MIARVTAGTDFHGFQPITRHLLQHLIEREIGKNRIKNANWNFPQRASRRGITITTGLQRCDGRVVSAGSKTGPGGCSGQQTAGRGQKTSAALLTRITLLYHCLVLRGNKWMNANRVFFHKASIINRRSYGESEKIDLI